jgi:hypothetical protein
VGSRLGKFYEHMFNISCNCLFPEKLGWEVYRRENGPPERGYRQVIAYCGIEFVEAGYGHSDQMQ